MRPARLHARSGQKLSERLSGGMASAILQGCSEMHALLSEHAVLSDPDHTDSCFVASTCMLKTVLPPVPGCKEWGCCAAELDAFGAPIPQNGFAAEPLHANGPVLPPLADVAPPSQPPGRPHSAMSSAASMQPAAVLAGLRPC